ncbi:MAG: bifunctional 3-(3-hydroxy-phenyl)propionate/3-hydroxycinnamic acid hydroxylase, partial [Pseudomonadota bacterium]
AIVGMGPVGSAAAILFAHAGLKVAIFERDKEVYALPRAVGMDGEIVRGFQRIGLGDNLAGLLQKIRPGDRAGFANSKREWLFGNEFVEFGANGWQPLSMFDQPEVDGYLRNTAINHPSVTAHIGHEVLGFEQNDEQVDIQAKNLETDEAYSITTRYLLACDGASSSVRKALDIGWHDLDYDHDWLVIDIIIKDGHKLDLDTVQVCDPDRLATYVATKDPYRRWEFKLNSGETWNEMVQPEKIYELVDPWTPRDTYELRRAAVYQFHAATADTWRVGRVLLAGDAAHQTPPFLGQGMNAGMRDVINLAWKFPLILSGEADESLLDTYQAERGAHATDLVEWAVAIGKLMEHMAAVELAQREGREPPKTPPAMQSSGYGQGRENPPIRDGAVIIEQVSNEGSTGYLFSQPIVQDADGNSFRLDERLGSGFAIVARTAADLSMNAASQTLVDKLGIATATLEGLTEQQGHFDRLFESASAVIVRPDRYVFGHTSDDLNLDDLLGQLGQKLSLR